MENIGFKTTAFKSENQTLQKAKQVQENSHKEDALAFFGLEKSQKILLKYLNNEIYPAVLIQELNEIKRHFFSQE